MGCSISSQASLRSTLVTQMGTRKETEVVVLTAKRCTLDVVDAPTTNGDTSRPTEKMGIGMSRQPRSR